MTLKRKVFIGIMVLIIAVLLILKVSMVIREQSRVCDAYDQAVQMLVNGDYQDALILLDSIRESRYADIDDLDDLCNAAICYDANDIDHAHEAIWDVSEKNLPDELIANYRALMDTIQTDYLDAVEQREKERFAAYQERIRTGVPYVGMSESEIKNTSLGSPSSQVRHNYECIGGEQYLANLYDFYEGKKCVFTARCVRGSVTEVWDDRGKDYSWTSYSKETSSQKDKDDDPYHASDYYHPEDFYDDNYDSFFDYEDAEDYWYDHND